MDLISDHHSSLMVLIVDLDLALCETISLLLLFKTFKLKINFYNKLKFTHKRESTRTIEHA